MTRAPDDKFREKMVFAPGTRSARRVRRNRALRRRDNSPMTQSISSANPIEYHLLKAKDRENAGANDVGNDDRARQLRSRWCASAVQI